MSYKQNTRRRDVNHPHEYTINDKAEQNAIAIAKAKSLENEKAQMAYDKDMATAIADSKHEKPKASPYQAPSPSSSLPTSRTPPNPKHNDAIHSHVYTTSGEEEQNLIDIAKAESSENEKAQKALKAYNKDMAKVVSMWELKASQHQAPSQSSSSLAILGSLKGNKSSNLMPDHYQTIQNNGSCREDPTFKDEHGNFYMSQCILISIMDHLKLIKRLAFNCSITQFIKLHSEELNNWNLTSDYQVGDEIKNDLLRRLCEKEGLELKFVYPAINNDGLMWNNNGIFDHMIYKKDKTDVYILCLPNHYELLINGFNENRYNKELVKYFITREIDIEKTKEIIDYYRQNTINRNENIKRVSSINRLQALIAEQRNNINQLTHNDNNKDMVKDMRTELAKMMNYLTDETKATYYLKNNEIITNKYLKYKQKYLQLKNLLKKQKIL